ncbi:MAG TPA: High-affinity nickel transporter [Candidatus Binatia bacterium]|nr:High-affinity nickel transporter [Candidatus Binatia bacterium]
MIWAAIAAGFVAGLVHVLSGPDHLAAVAPFAIGRGARGWRTGLQWGLGHCAGVLVIGLLALMFRELLPLGSISSSAEKLIGVLLIAVGAWGICKSLVMKRESPEGGLNAPLVIGTVHGLAGSSHLLGVIPGLLFPTAAAVCFYFIAFAAGTITGMAGFSAALGLLPQRVYRGTMAACSCAAVLTGGYWLIA